MVQWMVINPSYVFILFFGNAVSSMWDLRVPQLGIESMPPAGEWSLNNLRTTEKVPKLCFQKSTGCCVENGPESVQDRGSNGDRWCWKVQGGSTGEKVNRREVYFRSRINRVGNEEQVRNDSQAFNSWVNGRRSKLGMGRMKSSVLAMLTKTSPLVVTVINTCSRAGKRDLNEQYKLRTVHPQMVWKAVCKCVISSMKNAQ